MPEDFDLQDGGDDFEAEGFEGVGEQSDASYDVVTGELIDPDLEANPIPVDVVHTSDIYERFAAQFGAEEARRLQDSWGDTAVHNQGVVRTLAYLHP